MNQLRRLDQSQKLRNVLYDIRGEAHDIATRLEAQGHRVLKLNTGNPAEFGFEAPFQIVRDVINSLPHSHGYGDSRGLVAARRAVVDRYDRVAGFPALDPDDVLLGNGVSELITMTMQALLNNGDEVLIPSPDYPLWTAMTSLGGGVPVHYTCAEGDEWNPNLDDIRSKITDRTKAIVVINPNNPTGAVYSREVLEGIAQIAREHSLLVLADEIYDRIIFDGAEHVSLASLAPDLLCLTFNGLSKTYRVAGYRAGWLVVTGPQQHARGFLEGLALLASTRLSANLPGQHAIQAALSGAQSIDTLIARSGRLHEQRDAAWLALESIPGVACVRPRGALYAFPRLDPEVHEIVDDSKFVIDFLRREHVLLSAGSGFNIPTHDHLRIVTLPEVRVLKDAIQRLGNFLASYRA